MKLCGICSENETWSVVFKSIRIFNLALKLLHKMHKRSDFKFKEWLLHWETSCMNKHNTNVCHIWYHAPDLTTHMTSLCALPKQLLDYNHHFPCHSLLLPCSGNHRNFYPCLTQRKHANHYKIKKIKKKRERENRGWCIFAFTCVWTCGSYPLWVPSCHLKGVASKSRSLVAFRRHIYVHKRLLSS